MENQKAMSFNAFKDAGISEEEDDRPIPRLRPFLQNRGHRKSWCELQAVIEVTPTVLPAAVKNTQAMIQAAAKATPASVRKRLSLEYELIDKSLDLGPSCKIEGTERAGVNYKQQ